MPETLTLGGESKEERYQSLMPQLSALMSGESDDIANMANVAAVLKESFDFFWVGFYRVLNDELILGPFQGPLACTRIAKGKGACGQAWLNNETIVIPDVDKFPGHIACSSLSRSEIVLPIHDADGVVVAILDIDSDETDSFDHVDKQYLEALTLLFKKD